MLSINRILVGAVCLSAIAGQLHGWQTTSGQQEQSSTEEQALVDEFDAAVARCEEHVRNIVDAREQSTLFLKLAMVHQRLDRNEDAARFLKSFDRSDLRLNDQDDFDFLHEVLEDGISGWLKSLDTSALEWGGDEGKRDSVYVEAIFRCPSELASPLVEKLVTDTKICTAYVYLAMKQIRKGNLIQAEAYSEKWLAHAIAAYRSSGGGNVGQLDFLACEFWDEGAIDLAQQLSQRVFEFADKENELPALWRAAFLAGRTGMPELAQKAGQRIKEVGGEYSEEHRPIGCHVAMAYARQGNHKLAVQYLDDCSKPHDFVLLSAIVQAMVRDNKVELAREFANNFGDVSDAIDMHLEMAKVAGELGMKSTVKSALARCREIASDNTKEISQNESTRCWYFENIARAHFRLEEVTVCNEWIKGFTDERYKARALMGKVEWMASRLAK